MQQLIMNWKNDHTAPVEIHLPEGFRLVRFPELPNAVEQWLDVVQYGLTEKREDAAFYQKCMPECSPWYDENYCFFIAEGDKAVATITVICDRDKKDALGHMLACDPAYRGKKLGLALFQIFMNTVKEEGMETAHFTTDDWRLPAIKIYLGCGFEPDESTDDFKARWKAVRENLSK